MNTTNSTLGPRRYDLDWVRIGAFMLLILYHVGMYYVTWDWHVKSPHASTAIEPLLMLTAPWRLTLLFFVSGLATAYLLERTGTRGFLRQRSVRLLLPLLFGMAVIVPPQSYFEVVEKLKYAGNYPEFYRLYLSGYHGFCRENDCLLLPTWNHLWFVAYLWVYTTLLFIALRIFPSLTERLRDIARRRLTGAAVLWWPIAILCLARLTLAGRFPATHALLGDWYNHASYLPIFVLGFAMAGASASWATLERLRWPSLGFAILVWAALSAYFGMYSGAADPAESLRMGMRLVYGCEQWLAIAAVVGFARRHWNVDNAARRYLTTAIFPVYILHQTIIVVVAHSLKPAQLNPVVEAVLLVLVTVSCCFLGYEGIRRVRLLRPLFGLAKVDLS